VSHKQKVPKDLLPPDLKAALYIKEDPFNNNRPIGLVVMLANGQLGYSVLHPADISRYPLVWNREFAWKKAVSRAQSGKDYKTILKLRYELAAMNKWGYKFHCKVVLYAFQELEELVKREAAYAQKAPEKPHSEKGASPGTVP
jgi:hypothetical protein